MRIVFMGTPDFAVGSLAALSESGKYEIVSVITQPDRPKGRGNKVLMTPVKEYALIKCYEVYQPVKVKTPEFVAQLKEMAPDLIVVAAFGQFLSKEILEMPKFGCINVHASLLPKYRGAAPINWAIINGDKETGVTTFFLQHEIDTGEIIHQEHLPIGDEDNVEVIHDALMEMGAALVLRTVDDILDGSVHSISQSELMANITGDGLRPAPKLFRENTQIDWNASARYIHDFVRGLSPYPAAWTNLVMPDGTAQVLKIFDSRVGEGTLEPGELMTDGKSSLLVGTGDGVISIRSLQLAGKKRMPVEDFLRGHSVLTGCKLQ